ncbi:unnamed protein product [Ectocarpus sp. 4 AP-2014]
MKPRWEMGALLSVACFSSVQGYTTYSFPTSTSSSGGFTTTSPAPTSSGEYSTYVSYYSPSASPECNPWWISDGMCDSSNNNADCAYDGGDCCICDCVDTESYCCGYAGFSCLDPTSDCFYHHYDDDYDYDYGEYGADCGDSGDGNKVPSPITSTTSADGKRVLGMRWSAQRLLEKARLDIGISTISYICSLRRSSISGGGRGFQAGKRIESGKQSFEGNQTRPVLFCVARAFAARSLNSSCVLRGIHSQYLIKRSRPVELDGAGPVRMYFVCVVIPFTLGVDGCTILQPGLGRPAGVHRRYPNTKECAVLPSLPPCGSCCAFSGQPLSRFFASSTAPFMLFYTNHWVLYVIPIIHFLLRHRLSSPM